MMSFIWQEVLPGAGGSAAEPGVEEMIVRLVLWLKLAIEVVGALIVGFGAVGAVYRLAQTLISPSHRGYHRTRLMLSRYLALALEFQLAADILGTAVAPTWTQLGKLGAVALIRTALNYFLGREMKEEEERIADREGQLKESLAAAQAD
jgi:uncharacterized membrane protein